MINKLAIIFNANDEKKLFKYNTWILGQHQHTYNVGEYVSFYVIYYLSGVSKKVSSAYM